MNGEKKNKSVPTAPKATTPKGAISAARETSEPTAGSGQGPLWLVVLVALLLFWGQSYMEDHAAGFDSHVYGPYQSSEEVASAVPKGGAEDAIRRGAVVYASTCAACHKDTGLGNPGQFPPLAGSDWVNGTPDRLIRIPLFGVKNPIKVKGEVFGDGSQQMGPMGAGLSPEDLAAALTYIRQAWGNKGGQVTVDRVASVKQATASRAANSQWTEAELLQVPDQP